MKLIARRGRSVSGEETMIDHERDKDDLRLTCTLERDEDGGRHLAGELDDDFADPVDERGPPRRRGRRFPFDENNHPRGAPMGPPDAKFVVHDVRPLSAPHPKGTYLVVVTRAADGRHAVFKVLSPPREPGFTVEEEDEGVFHDLFGHAAMVPGKIAGLVNDIKAGAPVALPVELDNV